MTPTVPVLIVGAGPVGLGLAIDLGTRGVACTVVEARDGSVAVPKMSQVTARSMELCRRWGVAHDVESAAWPHDYPQDFVYVTSLTGYELARSPFPPYAATPERAMTPHGTIHCPQIFFDPILRRRAAALPAVSLRYHTRLESFADDGAAVTCTLRDAERAEAETIVARYLVGCDGAGSLVRETLGIPFVGAGKLSHSLSIFFRAPQLATLHDKGWARFYRLLGEDGHWADLVAIDGRELWRLTILDLGERAPEDVDVDATLRRMAGVPFAYEILSTLPWERRDLIAASYRSGNVFLAGDAAHVLSPTGGLGMNTGLGDAFDLGWKLAAALDGWAGSGLLDSYERDRRPIAEINVEASTAYFKRTRSVFPIGLPLADPTPGGDAARRAFAEAFDAMDRADALYVSEHLKIGYTYETSPICVADGSAPPPPHGLDYVPNARPGARAPHVALPDGGSLLDVFGDGFTLLRLGPAPPDVRRFEEAARARRVPVRVYDVPAAGALALYERRLALVRPDGHVAWRGDALPADPGALLDVVRGAASAEAARIPA